MKNSFNTNVRRIVWQLLSGKEEFPSRALEAALADVELDPRDFGLAKELLSGVLRSQIILERISAAYATRRVKEQSLQVALNIGLYQLLYLDRMPRHAAIDTTLEAVKPELNHQIGFLNAVLRAVSRDAKRFTGKKASSRDRLPEPAWQFNRGIFPEPKRDEVGYMAETRGYPKFMMQRWWDDVGAERALKRATVLNYKAALWLRINPLRCNGAEVQSALEAAGIEVAGDEEPGMLRVVSQKVSVPIHLWPGFEQGHWSVQDRTSFQSIDLAKAQKGERILDLCAAPGGKSFAVYEATGGEAEVLACDISEKRLAVLEKEATRLGHKVKTLVLDPAGTNLPQGPWDLLLCDVPCSNTGVLNKRPEARGRFHKIGLHEVMSLQNVIRKRLILPSLNDNSRVLWTTCSLEPEENRESAERLAKVSKRAIVREQLFEPSRTRSGGYSALIDFSS